MIMLTFGFVFLLQLARISRAHQQCVQRLCGGTSQTAVSAAMVFSSNQQHSIPSLQLPRHSHQIPQQPHPPHQQWKSNWRQSSFSISIDDSSPNTNVDSSSSAAATNGPLPMEMLDHLLPRHAWLVHLILTTQVCGLFLFSSRFFKVLCGHESILQSCVSVDLFKLA
jgi:hypothetical protein